MAKKIETTQARTNGNGNETNKAEAVRQYKAEHPEATNKDVANALSKKGIEVNPGRVSAILRSGSTGGNRVNVDAVKLAAEFIAEHDGQIEEAIDAIRSVGGFIEKCGSAQKAVAALEAYKALAEVVVRKK